MKYSAGILPITSGNWDSICDVWRVRQLAAPQVRTWRMPRQFMVNTYIPYEYLFDRIRDSPQCSVILSHRGKALQQCA